MNRNLSWLVALALLAGSARAQTSTASSSQDKGAAQGKAGKRSSSDARHHFYAAQAALFAALTHAEALEQMSDEPGENDMDLARSYVHTISRNAQACDGETVKVGEAKHSVEKDENMTALRKELSEALKAADEAQNAVDGHGSLGPEAKNTTSHLQKALAALIKLGDAAGIKPLPAPGAAILRASREAK